MRPCTRITPAVETEQPTRASCRMDSAEPELSASSTEKVMLILAPARSDSEDPSRAFWNSDVWRHPLEIACLYTESPEPKQAALRVERLEPRASVSKTESLDPETAVERVDKELPSCAC